MDQSKFALSNRTKILAAILVILICAIVFLFYIIFSSKSQTKTTIHHLSDTDSGKTIHMKTGDVVSLDLHKIQNGSIITTHIDDQNVLTETSVNHFNGKNNDYIGNYTAKGVGTTTITIEERPRCNLNQVCPQYILVPFQITVISEK